MSYLGVTVYEYVSVKCMSNEALVHSRMKANGLVLMLPLKKHAFILHTTNLRNPVFIDKHFVRVIFCLNHLYIIHILIHCFVISVILLKYHIRARLAQSVVSRSNDPIIGCVKLNYHDQGRDTAVAKVVT